MKYLISGRNGQLAKAFIVRLSQRGADYSAPDETDFNITNPEMVSGMCEAYRPDVIINCAAYNQVDRAEKEPDAAFDVNASGPGLLAREASKRGALLVHFGSDYVFDGLKEDGLYIEADATNPLNHYGESKLRGENSIRKETDNYLVMRLSWVFGEGTQNFIYKLRDWVKNNEYLKIVCDEFSVPTYTFTAADVTLKALEHGLRGVYHLTNDGYCSRYEWARLVLKEVGVSKFIRPVKMDSFDLPARRPMFSAMSNEKIAKELDVEIPTWEDAVRSFLREFSNG